MQLRRLRFFSDYYEISGIPRVEKGPYGIPRIGIYDGDISIGYISMGAGEEVFKTFKKYEGVRIKFRGFVHEPEKEGKDRMIFPNIIPR